MKSVIVAAAALTLLSTPSRASAGAAPEILVTAGSEARRIRLLPEETDGLLGRPLEKTRQRLDAKFGKGFAALWRVSPEVGSSITGSVEVATGPTRLTVYEMTKEGKESPRMLRVAATRVYGKGDTASFELKVTAMAEHLFLVTAERVKDDKDLNSHLRYLATQEEALTVTGFSTNWSLSAMRFKMAEKKKGKPEGNAKESEFAKDADWLVDALIDPQWIASIRVEAE